MWYSDFEKKETVMRKLRFRFLFFLEKSDGCEKHRWTVPMEIEIFFVGGQYHLSRFIRRLIVSRVTCEIPTCVAVFVDYCISMFLGDIRFGLMLRRRCDIPSLNSKKSKPEVAIDDDVIFQLRKQKAERELRLQFFFPISNSNLSASKIISKFAIKKQIYFFIGVLLSRRVMIRCDRSRFQARCRKLFVRNWWHDCDNTAGRVEE